MAKEKRNDAHIKKSFALVLCAGLVTPRHSLPDQHFVIRATLTLGFTFSISVAVVERETAAAFLSPRNSRKVEQVTDRVNGVTGVTVLARASCSS